MDADKILDSLGGWGKHQCLTYILLGFIYIRGAWPVLAILFIGGDPGHKCYVPPGNNSTGHIYNDGDCKLVREENGQNITEGCIYGYEYGHAFESTIMSDFELVCSKDYMVDLSSTIYMLGNAAGAVLITPLSDRLGRKWFDLVCSKDYMVDLSSTIYMLGNAAGAVLITPLSDRLGRKWVMLACLWGQGVVGTGAAFANSYVLFTALRFLVGFLNMAIALICYVMIAELFPSSLRMRPSIGVSMGWSVGVVSLALLGYLLPDWRHLEMAISLPNFLTLPYIWLLSESVSWLVSRRKTGQLREVLGRVCRWNNLDSLPLELVVEEEAATQGLPQSSPYLEVATTETVHSQSTLTSAAESGASTDKYTVVDLFRTTKMRRYTLIMFYLWFVNSLGYFGILFSTPALHGNIYINLAISGAVEIPALLICMFLMERTGRRRPLVLFMLLCGVMNIITVFIPTQTASGANLVPLITTLAMVGKFGISGSYSTSYLMSTEIFPTVIRNQAVGLSSFFENLGSVAAPFIVYGAKNFAQMPLVLFGVLTLIGGLLALFLPETHNRALPETIQDVEESKHGNRDHLNTDPPTRL